VLILTAWTRLRQLPGRGEGSRSGSLVLGRLDVRLAGMRQSPACLFAAVLLAAGLTAGCGGGGGGSGKRFTASTASLASTTPSAVRTSTTYAATTRTSASPPSPPGGPSGPQRPTAPSRRILAEQVTAVVRHYYDAIDAQDYDTAWNRLSAALQSRLGGESRWMAGYQTTTSTILRGVRATSVSPTAGTVAVQLASEDLDACADDVRQRFAGALQLGRSSGRWQITDMSVQKVAGGTPVRNLNDCPASGPSTPPATTPRSFCATHACIPNFGNGTGYIVQCNDGTWSHSGGRPGACSDHGGESSGTSPSAPPAPPSDNMPPSAGNGYTIPDSSPGSPPSYGQCADGSTTQNAGHPGACSHHGGLAEP
jgi:hypothetical protein